MSSGSECELVEVVAHKEAQKQGKTKVSKDSIILYPVLIYIVIVHQAQLTHLFLFVFLCIQQNMKSQRVLMDKQDQLNTSTEETTDTSNSGTTTNNSGKT